MSYNATSSQIASETRAQLARLVTDARRTSTESERPLVELAGQVIAHVLDGVDDNALVELQFHGSDLQSQDSRVWFVAISTRRIIPKATQPAAEETWDSTQGPLVARTVAAPGDTSGT